MSRYSSDSDSSSYRHIRRKRRSDSSSSSDVTRHKRSKSSKHSSSSRYKKSKRYSSRSYKRSRSRSKTSSRRSRSASKDRHRRSHSRDKYKSKQRYKSRSQSKGNSSKYDSRSSSSDSKNSSSSSTSKSSSGSSKTIQNNSENPDEQLREKLLKAIKAAESADHQLKQQGVLPKGVRSRNTITSLTPSQPQCDVLKDINADEFVPKAFKSSRQTKEENFDDLNIPSAAAVVAAALPEAVDESSIFYVNTFNDPNGKLDRWVKKLFQIRQKAISGDPLMGCGVISFLKKTEKTCSIKIN